MTVRAASAKALALWVRAYYPAVYNQLATRATKSKLGQDVSVDFTDGFDSNVSVADTGVIPDTSSTSTVFDTIDPNTFSPATIEAPAALPDITVPAAPGASASDLAPQQPPVSATTTASPAVLSSVGNFLTTGGGLNALLGLGTAVVNNVTSRNVLQTQVARVSAGLNPAAISYVTDPRTGLVTPVLQTTQPTVSYPVTNSLLGQLVPQNAAVQQIGSFIQQYWLWLALGGLVLALA